MSKILLIDDNTCFRRIESISGGYFSTQLTVTSAAMAMMHCNCLKRLFPAYYF